LLISALAVLPDWKRAISMDFKAAGDAVFWIGAEPEAALGRSELAQGLALDDATLETPSARVAADYTAFEAATAQGIVASAVASGWGGAAGALARSALSGGLSAQVKAGWSTAQWFTESAGGILATTASGDAAAFVKLVPNARQIGTVTDTETLVLDGEAISTTAVLAAYRRDESGEISQ
jgi:phosphoribosylformylglycinamidine synthase